MVYASRGRSPLQPATQVALNRAQINTEHGAKCSSLARHRNLADCCPRRRRRMAKQKSWIAILHTDLTAAAAAASQKGTQQSSCENCHLRAIRSPACHIHNIIASVLNFCTTRDPSVQSLNWRTLALHLDESKYNVEIAKILPNSLT